MTLSIPLTRRPHSRNRDWTSALASLVLLLFCCACGKAEPEAIERGNLVGRWSVDTGTETEWFDLDANGSFTARIRRDGFLSTTLSDGPRLKATGKWSLASQKLTMTIEGSDDAALIGQVHEYDIDEVSSTELTTTDHGGQSLRLKRSI